MQDKRISQSIEITWRPDKQSKTPIYQQIVNYFSQKISSGDWISGQKLPSQRKLSQMFETNRSTIVTAIDELQSLGLVETAFGGGTQVSNDIWNYFTGGRTPNWQKYINASGFRSNIPTVQIVNHMEFEEDVLRMSSGELSPDLLRTDLFQKVLSKMSKQELFLNYPDPLGMPGLRREVQKYLKGIGIDVPISCILIVSGALQALQLISIGIVRDNSTIYLGAPSYLNSLNIFQSAGAVLEGVAMDASGIQPWLIKSKVGEQHNALVYTIPSVHNPTGITMPLSRRQELLNYCAERCLPIIEDDVFRDLWLDEEFPRPIKALPNSENVLYIGSMSKCFTPGLRIGWLVSTEPVVQRLADIKMQTDYGVSPLLQHVAEEMFKSGLYDEGTESIRVALHQRRDAMTRLLGRYMSEVAEWNVPSGGFFVWVHLKNGVSAERLFYHTIKEKLLIMPGNSYGEKYVSHIRLSYGYLSEEEMEYAVRRLARIIRENKF